MIFFGAWKDTRIAGSIPGHPSCDSSGFPKGEKCFMEIGYLICKTIMGSILVLQWELKIKIFFHRLWAFKKFEYTQSRTCFILQPVLSLVFAWHWFKSWFNQRSKGSNLISFSPFVFFWIVWENSNCCSPWLSPAPTIVPLPGSLSPYSLGCICPTRPRREIAIDKYFLLSFFFCSNTCSEALLGNCYERWEDSVSKCL